jgi:hypothetical protein
MAQSAHTANPWFVAVDHPMASTEKYVTRATVNAVQAIAIITTRE